MPRLVMPMKPIKGGVDDAYETYQMLGLVTLEGSGGGARV